MPRRRSALCCALRRVSPPGRYPAPVPCGVRTFLTALPRGCPACRAILARGRRGYDPAVAHPFPIEPFLRIRSASTPAFVDAGTRLAFLGDMTGVPQIYVMDADGGWPDQLT